MRADFQGWLAGWLAGWLLGRPLKAPPIKHFWEDGTFLQVSAAGWLALLTACVGGAELRCCRHDAESGDNGKKVTPL